MESDFTSVYLYKLKEITQFLPFFHLFLCLKKLPCLPKNDMEKSMRLTIFYHKKCFTLNILLSFNQIFYVFGCST